MSARRDRVRRLARAFALGVGGFLVLDGITGIVFAGTGLAAGDPLPHREWNWFFEFNDWHHLLHVATGGILVAGGLRTEWLPHALLAFGAVYLVLTPVAVLDGDDVAGLVYSDARDNVIHGSLAAETLVLGIAALRLRTRTSAAGTRPATASPPGRG